jgi:hypothetical protein
MRHRKSYSSISFVEYPWPLAWLGVLSMAVFRIPLGFRRNIQFFKLMGCGKGEAFDFHPDWKRWAILAVHSDLLMTGKGMTNLETFQILYGKLASAWIRIFRCRVRTVILEALDGHGRWDGKTPFLFSKEALTPGEKIAILTRATIRIKKLRTFWKNAKQFNHKLSNWEGLQFSLGIGEMPFLKQATFSIWENVESMKSFAYQSADHVATIQKTRSENWYREEMFIRFRVIFDTF